MLAGNVHENVVPHGKIRDLYALDFGGHNIGYSHAFQIPLQAAVCLAARLRLPLRANDRIWRLGQKFLYEFIVTLIAGGPRRRVRRSFWPAHDLLVRAALCGGCLFVDNAHRAFCSR